MDKMKTRHATAALETVKQVQTTRPGDGRSFRQRTHLRVALRALMLAMVVYFLAFAPWTARAQSALESTQIVVGAATQTNPGEPLTVQAVLGDSQGRPISKAVVYFVTSASFLKDTGDVVLAEAVTNADGQAVAEFANNFSGTIALRAEFRGDAQYAPSKATLQTEAAAGGQIYVEHVGVDIPGFNVPPVLGASRAAIQSPQFDIARSIQSLWPAMNGWPVAAALIIVWSMYLLAVRFVFRLAALGSEAGELTSTDSMGSL